MSRTRHLALILFVGASLLIFFGVNFFYFPDIFQNEPINIPEPLLYVEILQTKINLGESFSVSIISKNIGDQADIQIVSIGFPQLEKIDERVKITSYNFTQSPHYVKINDEIGAKYTTSNEFVNAKYPSIEAYGRPVPQDTSFQMVLQVTPNQAGQFEMYAKTIAIPHSSDRSHFPHSGFLDLQDEFVDVYSVDVIP